MCYSVLLFSLCVSTGMLLAGFILRNIPVVTDAVYIDIRWSSSLRNIALGVILVKAGLQLDGKVWNHISPCEVTPKTLWLTRDDVPSYSLEFSFSQTPLFFWNAFSFHEEFSFTENCTLRKIGFTKLFCSKIIHLCVFQALKKLKAVCLRLSMFPLTFEATTMAVVSYLILGLPWVWGFILG